MEASILKELSPSNYDNDELAWVIQLAVRAALNDKTEIELEFSWDRYDSLPKLDLKELGYDVFLDHPLKPEVITISWN